MKQPPSIFDFDGTLCSGNTFHIWLRSDLIRHPWRLPLALYRWRAHRKGVLPDVEWRTAALAGLRGRTCNEVRAAGESLYRRQIRPRLRPWLLNQLRERQAAGECTVLATAAFDFLVAPFAREMRVDLVVAWNLEYVNGFFTGRLIGPQPLGEEKLHRVRELTMNRDLDWSRSWAISDSLDDAALLGAVAGAALLWDGESVPGIPQKWARVSPWTGVQHVAR